MTRSSLLILALVLAGCSTQSLPTAPSATVSSTASSSSPAAAPAAESPATAAPGEEIAADAPAPENCGETDPKKWLGFSYAIELTHVTMRNASSCDRLVTWRAFVVISDSNQPPAGDAVLVLVPAGAGYGAPGSRLERPWVMTVHYSGGTPPCGRTIQVDGRAGNVPNMAHLNASFTAGRTFPTQACAVVVTPPTTPPTQCVPKTTWTFVSERDVTPGVAPASIGRLRACSVRIIEITETNGCTTRTRIVEREVCPQ